MMTSFHDCFGNVWTRTQVGLYEITDPGIFGSEDGPVSIDSHGVVDTHGPIHCSVLEQIVSIHDAEGVR